MSLLDQLGARLLTLLGLDFDLSLDLVDQPFHRVTRTLTLGSRPRPEQLGDLHEQGITHVVSILPEDDRPELAFLDNDFDTLFLPLRDGVYEDIGAHFQPFFEYVGDAGPTARVLVHCEVGVSRSATLVTAHVMQTEHRRFYEAFRQVRLQRPQVLPNVGFASELQRLEHRLFREPRADGPPSLTRYLHEVCNVPVEIEVLHAMLERHDHDAIAAIQAIFDGDIPRVVQGVRL